MRGACVVQMDGILLHLRGGDFGLGGVHSAWVNPGTGNDLVPAGEWVSGTVCQLQAERLKSLVFSHIFLPSQLYCIFHAFFSTLLPPIPSF